MSENSNSLTKFHGFTKNISISFDTPSTNESNKPKTGAKRPFSMSRSWSSRDDSLFRNDLMHDSTKEEEHKAHLIRNTSGELTNKTRGFTMEDIRDCKKMQQQRRKWLKQNHTLSKSQTFTRNRSEGVRKWSPDDLATVRETVIKQLKHLLDDLKRMITETSQTNLNQSKDNQNFHNLLVDLHQILIDFMFPSQLENKDLGKKCIIEIQALQKKHDILFPTKSPEQNFIIQILFILSNYSRVQEYVNNVYQYMGNLVVSLQDKTIQKHLDYLSPPPIEEKKHHTTIPNNNLKPNEPIHSRKKLDSNSKVKSFHEESMSPKVRRVERSGSGPASPFSLSKSCSLPTLNSDPRNIVCRMCEKAIAASIFEEHSKYCAIENTWEMIALSQESQLNEVAKVINEKIKELRNTQTGNAKSDENPIDTVNVNLLSKLQTLSQSISVPSNQVNWEEILHRLKEMPPDETIQKIISEIEYLLNSKALALKTVEEVPPPLSRTDSPKKLNVHSPNRLVSPALSEKFSPNFDLKNIPTISSFHIVKAITEGAFGRVFLARKKRTNDLYAIKVLRKSDMIQKNQVKHVKAERNILAFTTNPFIIKMYYAFQSDKYLYLVLEYASGGDCFSLLQKFGQLDQDATKMYVAETVLALEYLHSKGIVHRDLKPDNMLIDCHGHIKLTDFGLSCIGLAEYVDIMSQDMNRNFGASKRTIRSLVGTPDYLAPEVLLGIGHSFPVDWWSLGVVLFEFLTGLPPFYCQSLEEMFQNIVNLKISWPNEEEEQVISPLAKDLITKLLKLHPEDRLGFNGAEEVKSHPYFEGIEWKTLKTKDPPFIPSLDHPESTFYFDPRLERFPLENENKISSVVDDSGAIFDDPTFGGFWFINFQNLLSKNMEVVQDFVLRRTKSF